MPPHSEQIVSRICGALFRGSLVQAWLHVLLHVHSHPLPSSGAARAPSSPHEGGQCPDGRTITGPLPAGRDGTACAPLPRVRWSVGAPAPQARAGARSGGLG
ncbi:hypothetical protein BRO15_14230 [Xanthomonas oryzae pv. oryzae]|nr:hypothetical protein BRO15_14230 [Xanthomonas oryzae pv. oryzae]